MCVCQYIIFYSVQRIRRTWFGTSCHSPSRPPVSTFKEVGSVLVEPVEAKEVVCASSRNVSEWDAMCGGIRGLEFLEEKHQTYINCRKCS